MLNLTFDKRQIREGVEERENVRKRNGDGNAERKCKEKKTTTSTYKILPLLAIAIRETCHDGSRTQSRSVQGVNDLGMNLYFFYSAIYFCMYYVHIRHIELPSPSPSPMYT